MLVLFLLFLGSFFGSAVCAQDGEKSISDVVRNKSGRLHGLPTFAPVVLTETAAGAPVGSTVAVQPASKIWQIRLSDVNLAKAFQRWGADAGYTVLWNAPKHVLIDGASPFSGTFPQAVKQVLLTAGIYLGDEPLEACVYPNSPPLIRITKQGEQANECPGFEE